MSATSSRLKLSDGATLAYDRIVGGPPGVVFLHGLKSDRNGTKALALADHCARRGYGYVRFDMRGHGDSSGRFEETGPSLWRQDAISVLEALTEGPQILVGSSMGGWIMLLAALARPARIAGLLGIAPAADFTEDLLWAQFTSEQRTQIETGGSVRVPSDYMNEPYTITAELIADGRRHLLGTPINLACPVRVLHGQLDSAVPWQRSLQLADRLAAADVHVTLIKDGDHRLSRPQDMARILTAVAEIG
jgi:pimeloyl-ACP methyl ester carboxylesterase